MKLLAQQCELQAKIPVIEKSLDIVVTSQPKNGTGEELIADFEVSEGIYSRPASRSQWLGANGMLEYTSEEAGAHPREIMSAVLKGSQSFVRSAGGIKKGGQYNMKCRWLLCFSGHSDGMVYNSAQGNFFFEVHMPSYTLVFDTFSS